MIIWQREKAVSYANSNPGITMLLLLALWQRRFWLQKSSGSDDDDNNDDDDRIMFTSAYSTFIKGV